MALPIYATFLANIHGPQGVKGAKGDTGVLADLSVELLPWDSEPFAEMTGPDEYRGAVIHIPMPLPGPETVNNDDATELLVQNPTATRAALRDGFVQRNVFSVNVKEFGAIGDGTADDTAAINSAIAAAPAGSTVFFPLGTYKLAGSVTVLDQSVRIDAAAATFVQTTADPAVELRGSFGTTHTASAIGVGSSSVGGNDLPTVVLSSVGNGLQYATGDIVKVFSDDVVPGTDNAEDDIDPIRTGQFFSVLESTSNTVTLRGAVRDPMTTNVRIAKLSTNRVIWTGGVFRSTYTGPAMMFRVRGLLKPTVRDVTITLARGQAISLNSCLGYLVSNVAVNRAIDDPAAGYWGYGIDDNTNEFGVVENSTFTQCRHAYTSGGTRTVAGENPPYLSGRTYGAKVINCVAITPSSAGFDTHSNGQGISFVNCTVTDALVGYQLRGRLNSVVGCTADRVTTGVRIATDSSAGESYGHTVTDVTVNGCVTGLRVQVRYGATHPNYNVKDSRPNIVRGLSVRDASNQAIEVVNGTLHLHSAYLHCVGPASAERRLVRQNNSDLIAAGTLTIDASEVTTTSGSSVVFWMTGDGVLLEADRVRVISFSQFTTQFAKIIASDGGSIYRIDDLVSNHPVSDKTYDAVSNAGWVHYRIAVGLDTITDRYLETTGLSAATLDAFITATFNDITIGYTGGATTLGNLPSGRRGQQITLFNKGSGDITVSHGTTPKTALIGSTGKTVAAGGSIALIYDGVWRQVQPIG